MGLHKVRVMVQPMVLPGCACRQSVCLDHSQWDFRTLLGQGCKGH